MNTILEKLSKEELVDFLIAYAQGTKNSPMRLMCVGGSANASVTAVMNEFLTASENKVDRFAHDDYDTESMTDFLSDKEYTVAVYKASAQQPGSNATYTSDSMGDESYADLQTGDSVYVTITK